jgi:dihydrofolate reductase
MPTGREWLGLALIATSADGYIAREDGDISWLTDAPREPRHVPAHDGPHRPPEYHEFYASVDHLVIGRGTYEKVLTFGSWPYQGKKVIVLSTTLTDGSDANITVAPDVDAVVRLLAARQARRVYVDGGKVIQSFLRRRLLDELTVSVAPVLLGAGLPLFGKLDQDVRLIHLGSAAGDTGMVTSHYKVADTSR